MIQILASQNEWLTYGLTDLTDWWQKWRCMMKSVPMDHSLAPSACMPFPDLGMVLIPMLVFLFGQLVVYGRYLCNAACCMNKKFVHIFSYVCVPWIARNGPVVCHVLVWIPRTQSLIDGWKCTLFFVNVVACMCALGRQWCSQGKRALG